MKINLPLTKEESNHFQSTSGLATSKWGGAGWYFLFSCVMGGYPSQINANDKNHQQIKNHFKQMMRGLGYVMPCVFCRDSFKQFYNELPIEPYLTGRIELMYWLYLIRDKVNNKLINQEKQCYNTEKKRLKMLYNKRKISEAQYYQLLDKAKTDTLITQPSPPFIDVLHKYEKIRAVCSPKAKTCSLPKK
jgi:hypothetical protein